MLGSWARLASFFGGFIFIIGDFGLGAYMKRLVKRG
jgi:hypothetical protein